MATRTKEVPVAKNKSPTTTTSTTSTSNPQPTKTTAPTTTSSAPIETTSTPAVTTTTTSSSAKPMRATDRIKPNLTAAQTTSGSTSTATPSTGTGTSSNAPTTSTTITTSGPTNATTSAATPTTAVSTPASGMATSSSSSSSTETVVSVKQAPVTPSSPTENEPPATQVDLSQCALCGNHSSNSPDEMMLCLCCGCSFHARCANLPQTPEEGDIFCRWECFSTFRKNQGVPSKTPLGDFSKLAARVQSILSDTPHAEGQPVHNQSAASARHKELQARLRERSRRQSNGRSRTPSPYENTDRVPGGLTHNGYGRVQDEVGPPHRPVPGGRSPVRPRDFSTHVDLTMDDEDELPPPRSPRSRPSRGAVGRPPMDEELFDDAEETRSKRRKYLPPDDPLLNGGRRGSASRRDSYPHPPSRRSRSPSGNGVGSYANDIPPHLPVTGGIQAGMDGLKGGDPRQGFPPGPFDRVSPGTASRMIPPSGPGSARMPPVEDELGSRPSSGRSRRPGSGGTRYSDRSDEFDGPRGPPAGPSRSRPSSADSGRSPPDGPSGGRQMPAAMPPARYSIPWLNPAAFPAGLRERFNCKPDNVNGVFRIDLSPVFADKTMHLYQSEIDFFFRCFESADVSLVVKGMASELNQYIWAWPFILESCGSETHFSFDHFQFRHNANDLPDLEYVGELRLSMAAYNAYLERYLSGGMGNDVVTLEDHVTKKPITLVAGENIIALNNLVIAEHCAQLYNDLIKSFQWDVFAGGIHCLLQYLPQASRHKRFSSPLLHFNFPGARGRLRDPGNGTTDTAYQVLTGSLELVIFERLEPKDRDTFLRVLHAAGYDASKKSMLLDSHLRILRDSGFAWSTVLLTDGEFVHVNKGRLHFWRVVESETTRGPIVNAPCVFLSWEWVYQGVSQRGISTECWFAMKNASLCTGGWAFDPRRAIVEAAKCGVAIVRTGQFLNSLSGPGAPPVLRQLAFTGASPATIDCEVVSQRQEQMVLFLESILPCMDAIVEEEFELGLVKDDSDDFRKIFDDEIMWKVVDTALVARPPLRDADYECGICGLELTNIYKQCLGCTVHARRRRPNSSYPIFRICLRCHAQPERHHFKPRALRGYYDKLCSSEGHTGLLPATRRYQAERSYFKCRCAPYVRCADCGGCESCCCLCHTLFQTRFRFTAPEHLDHLRTDVVDVIKWHKQQQLPPAPPHLPRPHGQR